MSNFTRRHLEERYTHDPTFHRVTQTIYKMIADFGITPSELREACFMAHYKYEMENPFAIRDSVMVRMAEMYGDKRE